MLELRRAVLSLNSTPAWRRDCIGYCVIWRKDISM